MNRPWCEVDSPAGARFFQEWVMGVYRRPSRYRVFVSRRRPVEDLPVEHRVRRTALTVPAELLVGDLPR